MRKARLAILMLMGLLFTGLAPMPPVQATTLTAISPTQGPVGTTVTVSGTIDVLGGEFGIFFDAILVGFGQAPANSDVVITSFIVPAAVVGFHLVTLRDNATGFTDFAAFLVIAQSVISIDIKPGSDPNSINMKSKGRVPVAILSTPDFDATTEVNKDSLTFGRTGDEQSLAKCTKSNEDVNDDGLDDVVCHFRTQDTGFQAGDTEGILRGQTLDGTPIEGRDSVRIVN